MQYLIDAQHTILTGVWQWLTPHNVVYTMAHGFNSGDAALFLARFTVGAFFAISGFNKLFNACRHSTLKLSLTKNGIPYVPFMAWWVAGWEFVSGLMLAVGFMSAFSAGVLIIICLVACACESKRKVAGYNPINRGDTIACYLYLPEILYIILLSVNVLAGTGVYSIDALIWPI